MGLNEMKVVIIYLSLGRPSKLERKSPARIGGAAEIAHGGTVSSTLKTGSSNETFSETSNLHGHRRGYSVARLVYILNGISKLLCMLLAHDIAFRVHKYHATGLPRKSLVVSGVAKE